MPLMVLVGTWFLIAVRIDHLIDLLLTTVFCYTITVSLNGFAFSFLFVCVDTNTISKNLAY